MMRALAVAASILASTCLAATTQPAAGDYIVVPNNLTASGLIVVDGQGRASTLLAPPSGQFAAAPRMDVNNRDVIAEVRDRTTFAASIVRVSPGSVAVTLASSTTLSLARAIEVDADGSYLVADASDRLFRLAGGQVSTVASIPRPFMSLGLTIDPVTGDYWMAGFVGTLAVVDHRTGAVTTTQPSALRYLTGIDHDEATDTFIVAAETIQTVFFVDRNFTVLSSFATPSANGSLRLTPDGNIHVLDFGRTATEYSRAGSALRTTIVPFQTQPFAAFEIYGSRPVAGLGSARRGSTYRVVVSFPGSGGLPYVGALSLAGIAPGVGLPDGRKIALGLDPLFFLTAMNGDLPGITRGLRGSLSAIGQGTVFIALPASLPAGMRIFASAVVLDPSAPFGLRTANTWSFEVR